MNHESTLETLLTVKDVAYCLSISVRSVWRWTRMGRIPPPIKLGDHTVRWKASEIQELIDGAKATQPPASA